MSAKDTLLHTIKVNRRIRKLQEIIHPATRVGWKFLSKEQQTDELLRWKIKINKKNSHFI